MTSVMLLIFAVQLVLHLAGSVGAAGVNEAAWWVFGLVASGRARRARETARLRGEVVRLGRELQAVSAQDNFARWARLRREHDKAKERCEGASREQQRFRSTFERVVAGLRWLGTQGVNFFLNSWYAKQPMFWLPAGWMPDRAEWLLSFPRAPLGSVSVNVWSVACGSVIALVSEGVVALWTLGRRGGEVRTGPDQGETMAVPAPTAPEPVARKKEL